MTTLSIENDIKKQSEREPEKNILVIYSADSFDRLNCALDFTQAVSKVKWINCESELLLKFLLRNDLAKELYDDVLPNDLNKLLILIRDRLSKSEPKWTLVFDNVNEISIIHNFIKILKVNSLVLTSSEAIKEKLSLNKDVKLHIVEETSSLENQINCNDDEDTLLLKWIISFRQDSVSQSMLNEIIKFDQQKNTNEIQTSDRSTTEFSFKLSFNVDESIERLYSKNLIAKVKIFNETFIKIRRTFFKDLYQNLDQLKYRILTLFNELIYYETEVTSIAKRELIQPLCVTLILLIESFTNDPKAQSILTDLCKNMGVLIKIYISDWRIERHFYEKSLQILRGLPESKSVNEKLAEILNLLGLFHCEHSESYQDLKVSERYLNESLNYHLFEYNPFENQNTYFFVYNNLALVYVRGENYLKAKNCFANAIIYNNVIQIFHNLSKMYLSQYDIPNANRFIDKAIQAINSYNPLDISDFKRQMICFIYIQKSNCLRHLEMYEESQKYLEKAKQMLNGTNLELLKAYYISHTFLYQNANRKEEAISYANKCENTIINLKKNPLSNDLSYAYTINASLNLYARSDNATKMITEANRITQTINFEKKSFPTNDSSVSYRVNRLENDTVEIKKESLKDFKEISQIEILINYATVSGKAQLGSYIRALELCNAYDKEFLKANVLKCLGIYFADIYEFKYSQDFLSESYKLICKFEFFRIERAEICFCLASSHLNLKQTDDAIKYFKECLDIRESILKNNVPFAKENYYDMSLIHCNLALAYFHDKNQIEGSYYCNKYFEKVWNYLGEEKYPRKDQLKLFVDELKKINFLNLDIKEKLECLELKIEYF
jgi:tetratricopeptide (TPR) repeat protein